MLSRRAFVVAGAAAFSTFGAIREIGAQGRSVVRRSVGEMENDDPDLAAYRRAVAAMKALPAADPRNWNRFTNVHRNFCPHGNWYFLPWHRAYLASFERICRQLSGKPDFALPYWDWSNDRRLPAPFATGDAGSNPLFHPRSFSRNAQLPEDMVGGGTMTRIMNSPDFEAFGSTRPAGQDSADGQWLRRNGTRTELEFNPHDGVHTTLGGDMSQVDVASRDPIFWLHHANVDRIWAAWNARGRDNSRELMWLNFQFNRHFPNPNGSAWDVRVADVQTTEALGYQYSSEAVAAYDASALDAYAASPVYMRRPTHDHITGRPLPQRPGDGPSYPVEQRPNPRPIEPRQSAPYPAERPVVPAPHEPDRMVEDPSGGAPTGPSAELHEYRRLNHDALARAGRNRRHRLPSGGSFYVAAADNDRAASRERPVAVPLALGQSLNDVVGPDPDAPPPRRIWATIRDMEPPKDRTTRLHVFANAEDLSARTRLDHPSYATSVSFFSGSHGQHSGGPGYSVSVDLTPTLRRMARDRARGLQNNQVVLQMMPVCRGADSTASAVRPRRVEVVII
jgi:hypothetical protein